MRDRAGYNIKQKRFQPELTSPLFLFLCHRAIAGGLLNDSIHSKGIPKPSRRVREERAGCEGWGGCNINQLQNKTISKRTHLSSIFVSRAIEPLLAAF